METSVKERIYRPDVKAKIEITKIKIGFKCLICNHEWGVTVNNKTEFENIEKYKKGWSICHRCLYLELV